MSEQAVRFDGVTKRFGGTTAVDDLNLTVGAGEFFSLLGPSGCGKTTTLRMVAGFERPTEGEIFLEGKPVATVPPFKRHVNTVFQSYALFEHLDVVGNVAFGLKRRKVPQKEIDTRVAGALELVQMTGRETSKPNELSGGQRQRVALARALVNRPAVLLLDEPLGALDLKLRKQMQVELKAIQREVGITFVYVTHDQEEALAMSDRIAVMDHDVMMPDVDGPGTLERLRPVLGPEVPVVFLTAKVQPADVARLRELGAAGVLAKPFDPMRLPEELTQVLGR